MFNFPLQNKLSSHDLLPLILGSHLFLLFSTSLLNRQLCICGPHSLICSSVSSHCGLASTFSILFNCRAVGDLPMAKDKSCYFFRELICHHWFFTPLELLTHLLLCLLGFFFHVFDPSSSMFLLHLLPSSSRSWALCLFLTCPPNLGVLQSPLTSHIHSPRHSLP